MTIIHNSVMTQAVAEHLQAHPEVVKEGYLGLLRGYQKRIEKALDPEM